MQTPGDRACRYALGVDTILYAYAAKEAGDLAGGLHALAEDASTVALTAIESGDIESIKAASLRYAQASVVLRAIAHEARDDLLLAAEGLMEATKDMIEAETKRLLMKIHSPAVQS
ncbi:MAG: hypothetical protein EOP13_06295 [Pseudomonas sp.]|uniref:hypothetical protein n=1 Tax=Pseudomonas sp. TaxID=306 RepID=UPI001209429A|nr:hypothetical protein [Pseudomonas sp.]RZI75180.1 MAG: hypothetical protein EOP13_06295 [Pseudomonas sp.]